MESTVRVASVRAGNVIGGGDWAEDRLVPDCIQALQKNERIPVRNPASTRPWQHVLEPLGGYLTLAAALHREPGNPALASSFNFGPGPESNRSVGELVAEILQHWPGKSYDASDSGAPHEAGKLNLATEKALRLLNWRPAWSFQETVSRTVEWYRRQWEGAASAELCGEQIETYVRSQVPAQADKSK
jgi:CDP-glucose 4,6-dehydratase